MQVFIHNKHKIPSARALLSFLLLIMLTIFTGCATLKNMSENAQRQKLIERQSAIDELKYSDLKKVDAKSKVEPEALGDLYRERGKLDLALVQYDKASEANPDNTNLCYKKGLIYLHQGKSKEAEENFQSVLNKESNHALANEGMGEIYLREGKYESAQVHFKKAIAADAKLWKSHNFLGVIYDYQGKSELAIREYQAAIDLNSREPLIYNNLGVSYSLAGKCQEAVTAFRQAIQMGDTDKKIYNNMALALCKLGRYEEALQVFEKGGDSAQAYNNIGCALLAQGEYEQAITFFEKAIQARPSYYGKANENLEQAKKLQFSQSAPARQ